MNATAMTVTATATTSIGANTRGQRRRGEEAQQHQGRRQHQGDLQRAWMMTLIAKSAWPRAASWMPTTFSIAFPAIATMTRPANACDMPRASIAGSSAVTHQSDTSAGATLATASSVTASQSGQRGPA
jgi:hypothetical protein